MNNRLIFQGMQRDLDTLEAKVAFWRILCAGLAVVVVALLYLWPV